MHGVSKHKELNLDLEEYIQAGMGYGDKGGNAGNSVVQTFLDSNGSDLALTPEDSQELSDLIRKHMEFVQWKEGDIVLIDNKRVMHGRLPRDPKVERDVRVALFGAYHVETLKGAAEGAPMPKYLLKVAKGEQLADRPQLTGA